MSVQNRQHIAIEQYDDSGKLQWIFNMDIKTGETTVIDNMKVRVQEAETCGNCGAGKALWEKRNICPEYPPDYDWYCKQCGNFVRVSNH